MIRIRYRDPSQLSPGLHAAAERHGRRTTVYLLAGLTVPQRRAALRRLRMSARMGHCPRLPGWQLAVALLADQVRTALGRAGAVFRCHPAGITVPVMMASGGAIAFLVLSAVSIRVLHEPHAPGSPPGRAAPAPRVRPGAWPPDRAALVPRQVASDTDRVAPASPGPTGSPARPRPPGNPGSTPGGTPGTTPSSTPSGTPGATPSSTPSGQPTAGLLWPSLPPPPEVGVCVGVGQQGICGGG